jgi:hypothetical protein
LPVLIILIILLVVILILPVGASFEYGGDDIFLSAKAGPFRFRLLPAKEKPAPKREKKPREKKVKPERKKFRPDKDFILSLLKAVLRALGRFRRRLSVDRLVLRYTAASGDPFETAMQFGYVSAAAGTVLPLVDAALKIREKEIDINVDFDAAYPKAYVFITATLMIWEWLYIALLLATRFLILLIKFRRREADREREKNNGQTSCKRTDGSDNDKAQGDGGRQHGRGRPHIDAG